MKKFAAIALYIIVMQFILATQTRAEVEILICHEDDFGGSNWHRASIIQIAEILRESEQQLDLKVRRAICDDSMPDTVCAGIPGKLFCRQSSLRRMNLAASWFATHFVIGKFENYEQFRIAFGRPSKDAFAYADHLQSDSVLAANQELIREFAENELQSIDQTNTSAEIRKIATIQMRIMEFNFASLIGHEAYHVNNEICPIYIKSRYEKTGLLGHILELQTSNALFCASNPNPNEVKADRCAARQIERLHDNPISSLEDSNIQENFAQRAASDLIAFQALTGFRRFSGLPVDKYTIPNFDAYLNPTYRLSLLAGSVSSSADQPRMCGDTASLFVHGVQTSFQQCSGKGDVSDQILAELPKGVEKSWNGAPWTDVSISCDAE